MVIYILLNSFYYRRPSFDNGINSFRYLGKIASKCSFGNYIKDFWLRTKERETSHWHMSLCISKWVTIHLHNHETDTTFWDLPVFYNGSRFILYVSDTTVELHQWNSAKGWYRYCNISVIWFGCFVHWITEFLFPFL